MNYYVTLILITLLPANLLSYTDDSHFSKTFNEIRSFRIFTPPNYNPADTLKRYPVIYYFHGCRGSYKNSGTYSYSTWGLASPQVIGRPWDPDYEYPNNADFENFTYYNDVIIISADGKIEGLDGCGVYFPSLDESWEGNYYNFSSYIRELISVVDERLNTIPHPGARAISGLSMGGQVAIWLAASNPHLFSSASHFGHSPAYYHVGDPLYQTTVDVKELWRNLRGVPFRHSTNDRDYLRYYTEELYNIYYGAGFENEYYLADFCRHWAARVDLQFDFHVRNFSDPGNIINCFSYINLYPEFEVRDYKVSSSKRGNGWIYLRDVTKNGMGIYTRKRLPWGASLPPTEISVETPGVYNPSGKYVISGYSYRNDSFSTEEVTADPQGRLKILSTIENGRITGILGNDLEPPVFVLTDTVNENIYLKDNHETPLTFDVINLSDSPLTADFTVTTRNSDLLSILEGEIRATIPPQTRKRIDSFAICLGRFIPRYQNRGYIEISSSINGVSQERRHIFQVNVYNPEPEYPEVLIFDGGSKTIPLYKYFWSDWIHGISVSEGTITEGSGNGNGKVEPGETFSIWIKPPEAFDPADTGTWHPVVPLINKNNPDVSVINFREHIFSTGRAVLSAQIVLNRLPTADEPVIIPVKSRFLKARPLENDCHRKVADDFKYSYYEIVINADGAAGFAGIEQ